jgi:Na+-translocating ferredoxin:NAD+ oxidoreductase RnfG subunit
MLKYILINIIKINLLVIILLLFPFNLFSQEIKERVDEVIKNEFSENVIIDYEKYILLKSIKEKAEIEAKQRFYGEFVYILRIYDQEKLLAIALLDNVLGKELPITFLTIFDYSGKIILTDIIKYREPYGGAIQSDSWTSQFSGKDNKSGYRISEDIDGISGATISVKAVSAGVHKLSLLFQEIKDTIWILSYTDLINR